MSLFAELKRRNVFRVGIAYVVVAWLLMQVGEVMAPALHLPDWVLSTLAFFLILGFPLALLFAWAFEMTPEGLKRESEVDRSQSITRKTGRKLDLVIIGVLIAAVAFLLVERFSAGPEIEAGPSSAKTETKPIPAPATPSDGRKAIAVLPFENLSTDAENAFFAAGVHEDILTYLSRIAGLKVNSRTSVEQFAETDLGVGEIAAALGAAYIVEGSVRRAGQRVRVTAQLIDAATDEHLWAENFDRELTDIFAIQTAVAQDIVAALEAELSPREANMLAQRPTDSIEAYDLFLQARLALQDTDIQSTFDDTAVRLLERAVDIDPDYAQAWALLAVAHGDFFWFRQDPSITRLERMKQALDRALELQPDLPDARLALARYYYSGFYDYPNALEQLERLRSITPNEPLVHYHLGLTLRRLGRYDESIESFLQATRLDPSYEGAWAEAAETANSTGRRSQSLTIDAEISQRFPANPRMVAELASSRLKLFGDVAGAEEILASLPDASHYYLWTARALAASWSRDFERVATIFLQEEFVKTLMPGWGELEAARYLMIGGFEEQASTLLEQAGTILEQEIAKPHADNFAWPHAVYAMYLAMNDRGSEARAACEQGMSILPLEKDKVHGPQIATYCAWALGMAGFTDDALGLLEQLVAQGFDMNYWVLSISPEWDFLRDNERFQNIQERERQRQEARSPS